VEESDKNVIKYYTWNQANNAAKVCIKIAAQFLSAINNIHKKQHCSSKNSNKHTRSSYGGSMVCSGLKSGNGAENGAEWPSGPKIGLSGAERAWQKTM